MYKNHEQLEPIDENLTLWKYMDFLKFVNILSTNTIWFNRLDSFEDVYEGVYPEANKVKRPEIYGNEIIPQEIYDQIQKYARNRLYVLCFHNNPYESAAMWSLYAKESGVAIKTSINRLKQCFDVESKNIEISKVSYIDYNEDFIPEGNTFYLGTHKRKSFSHENEIRCMYLNQGEIGNCGVYINIDLIKFIDTIYISPYAPAYMEDTVRKLIEKYNLSVPIIKSKLYDLSK